MDCIFCKIAEKKIPSEIIYEDDKFMVFRDIKPVAPVHLLAIPKRHIPSVDHLEVKDRGLMGELILLSQKVANEQGVSEKGYRLAFNVGRDAGQTVEHLHLHLLGGKKLSWP